MNNWNIIVKYSGWSFGILVYPDIELFSDDIQYYLIEGIVCGKVAISCFWCISTIDVPVA